MSRNQKDRQRQELEKAIKIAGGVKALSLLLGSKRECASKWRNEEVEIPYQRRIKIAKKTGVNLDALSPDTLEENEAHKRYKKREIIEVPIKEITVLSDPIRDCMTEDRPPIMGTDCILITGAKKFHAYKAAGIKKVPVIVFDFESLFLATKPIFDIDIYFLFNEQVAICLRLEQLLGNRQGQRNDLLSSQKTDEENDKNSTPLRPILDEVTGRKDKKIAKLMKFNSKSTYHNAKQVFSQGSLSLINQLDQQIISIHKAFKMSKSPEAEQNKCIEQVKNNVH